MLLQALCIISNPSVKSNLSYSPETLNLVQNWRLFVRRDFENSRMTLKNNRAHLLYWSHSPEMPNMGKLTIFLAVWTSSNIKLCASFHHHMWIQTGVTVRKQLNGVMTSVTLSFDLWPWPLAWTSRLSMVITPENLRMIRWQEHCQKGVTDGQTDRQTDGNKCP